MAFAVGGTTVGVGREERRVTEGSFGGMILGNEKRLREKWRSGSLTNGARSGVLIMVLAVETSRQCLRVSSGFLVTLRTS